LAQEPADHTRDRILDAAEQLFARRGFAAVSVREITAAARSNLAAVNYHFGNKMNLYVNVFRERWVPRTRRVRLLLTDRLAGSAVPAIRDIIEAIARAFLDGPLTAEERLNHIQLMQRELASPTEALDMIVNEVIRPFHQELSALIRPNLPATVTDERLRLALLSILGMTLYFTLARPVISRLTGCEYDDRFKSVLIDHITAFAIDGIHSLTKD